MTSATIRTIWKRINGLSLGELLDADAYGYVYELHVSLLLLLLYYSSFLACISIGKRRFLFKSSSLVNNVITCRKSRARGGHVVDIQPAVVRSQSTRVDCSASVLSRSGKVCL
jgi:hypothetical protein